MQIRNYYGIIINHGANYCAVNQGLTNRQACPDVVLEVQLNIKQ